MQQYGVSLSPETISAIRAMYAAQPIKNKQEVSRTLGVSLNSVKKYTRGEASENINQIQLSPVQPGSRVLVIPDLHEPFTHPDAHAFVLAVRDHWKTNKVVLLGDEIDLHAISKYSPNPDGLSPGHELRAAIDGMLKWYQSFPEALVCVSNHTVRGHKKAFESSIPAAFLRSLETIINAPDGWRWEDQHVIDGVTYRHGDPKCGMNTSRAWVMDTGKSSVNGHTHSHANVRYFQGNDAIGADFGCLIDPDAYAFKYARGQLRATLGCGVVIEGKSAYFIPMHLGSDKRWIGRIL